MCCDRASEVVTVAAGQLREMVTGEKLGAANKLELGTLTQSFSHASYQFWSPFLCPQSTLCTTGHRCATACSRLRPTPRVLVQCDGEELSRRL